MSREQTARREAPSVLKIPSSRQVDFLQEGEILIPCSRQVDFLQEGDNKHDLKIQVIRQRLAQRLKTIKDKDFKQSRTQVTNRS